MPTIQRAQRKTKSTFHNDTPMRELRQKAYQTKEWKALRLSFIKQHPLCEECLRKGKITPAEDIHHLRSPFQGGKIDYDLLLDDKNLEALCKSCHGEEHQKEKGYTSPEDIIKALDEFMKNIPD